MTKREKDNDIFKMNFTGRSLWTLKLWQNLPWNYWDSASNLPFPAGRKLEYFPMVVTLDWELFLFVPLASFNHDGKAEHWIHSYIVLVGSNVSHLHLLYLSLPSDSLGQGSCWMSFTLSFLVGSTWHHLTFASTCHVAWEAGVIWYLCYGANLIQ